MKSVTKHYSNGEVTIVWQNEKCIHSTVCWKNSTGLPDVFNPKDRPWIKPEAAETAAIIEQVKKCPSGALSFFMNADVAQNAAPKAPETQPETQVQSETIIELAPKGPLMVYGNVVIKDADGNETRKSKVTALCRCGASANKPFCDGSHTKIDFQG
ncbi:MAG: (4Fe-4S)-binding protein [Chitinophagaceae bacterium]